jgi:riboflavin kinase/FMN adenylyltransferase
MKVLRGFDDPAAYFGGFVSVGNFDGVHRGHESMISALVDHARQADVPAVVFTFEPHPVAILRPNDVPPNLTTLAQKSQLLGNCGVDCVIAYPTNRELLDLQPEQFFERMLREKINSKGLVEGPNFCFGRNREGDIARLEQLCSRSGLLLDVVSPTKLEDEIVSSSAIRSRILAGDVAGAVRFLGRPYRIRGKVVPGDDRGRVIGFPTANLAEVATLVPADGVYAGLAHSSDGAYPAAINLGTNPTFDEHRRKLEIHLVGFAGDLYEQQLDVDFVDRVRDVTKFENIDALRRQLQRDVETVRTMLRQSALLPPADAGEGTQ